MKINGVIDSLGRIDEDMIQKVDFLRQKKRKMRKIWNKWVALAACLCLVFFGAFAVSRLGLFQHGNKARSGSGGKEGITYMSYAGPVFPLSALENVAELTLERNVNYDFSPYESRTEGYQNEDGETKSYETYSSQSIVTDSYTLTNPADKEQKVSLIYPFAGSLGNSIDEKPVISIDGETVKTKLHIGAYSGSFEGATYSENDKDTLNLSELDSWESYKALLETTDYQQCAFDSFPELNQPVVVYEISDMYGEVSDKAVAPTLNMEFTMDYDKTTILTYGFNGGTSDVETGYFARSLFIPKKYNPDYGNSAYLIVLGDDIGTYALHAYTNGGCEKPMENAGGTVTRYETTLNEIFTKVAQQYLRLHNSVIYGEDDVNILSSIPQGTFVGLAAELMYDQGLPSDEPIMRYDSGMLEDIFSDTCNMGGVMYLSFEVSVPSNGSLKISAKMVKQASIDYVGENKNRNGYDMVTTLGSNLVLTKQTASINNTENIDIINQNFGFDLENGITEVNLDITQEYYYLEVIKINTK